MVFVVPADATASREAVAAAAEAIAAALASTQAAEREAEAAEAAAATAEAAAAAEAAARAQAAAEAARTAAAAEAEADAAAESPEDDGPWGTSPPLSSGAAAFTTEVAGADADGQGVTAESGATAAAAVAPSMSAGDASSGGGGIRGLLTGVSVSGALSALTAAVGAAGAAAAGALTSAAQRREESTLGAEWWWLGPALRSAGVPVLDPRFAAAAQLLTPVGSPGQVACAADEVAFRLSAALQHAPGTVSLVALSPEHREQLFGLVCAQFARSAFLKSAPGLAVLRRLPIFRTAAGAHVALDSGPQFAVCPPESQAFVSGAAGSFAELLEVRPAAAPLLAALGVPELTDGDVLSLYILPRFDSMDQGGRLAALAYAKRHWPRLRSDSKLVSALKATPFVNGGRRPTELMDPSVPLLASVFEGQGEMFPAGQFATTDWLAVLRDCGLRSHIDAPLLDRCARSVEERYKVAVAAHSHAQETAQAQAGAAAATARTSGGAGPSGSAEVASAEDAVASALRAGAALTSHVLRDVRTAASGSLAEMLSTVAFVPATKGGPPGTPAAVRCLACFSGALLPDDWPLGWTAAPVLEPASVPPQIALSALRVRSPPPFPVVLAHLRACGEGGGEPLLATWPSSIGSPDEVFGRILAHVAAQWDGLGSSEISRLRALPMVPVGNGTRLASPDRLFIRTPVDLSPLAYELPATMAEHARVLRNLGACAAPATDDILALLVRAAAGPAGVAAGAAGAERWGGEPLSPNELRAVVRALTLLADSTGGSRTATGTAHPQQPDGGNGNGSGGGTSGAYERAVLAGAVPVPDERSALGPAGALVHMGGCPPWLRSSVDCSELRLVHPAVGPRLAEALRVPSLPSLVETRLDPSHPMRHLDALPGSPQLELSAVRERLADAGFAAAAADIARAAGVAPPPPRRLLDLSKGLAFVDSLRLRILLRGDERDVTRIRPRHSAALGGVEEDSDDAASSSGDDDGAGAGLKPVLRRSLRRFEYLGRLPTGTAAEPTGFSSDPAPPSTSAGGGDSGGGGAAHGPQAHGPFLVAAPPLGLPPSELVATALSRALGYPTPLPFGPLLTCETQHLRRVARVLAPGGGGSGHRGGAARGGRPGWSSGPGTGDGMGPGEEVPPWHAALARIRPARPFASGELVAILAPAPPEPPAKPLPPPSAAAAAAAERRAAAAAAASALAVRRRASTDGEEGGGLTDAYAAGGDGDGWDVGDVELTETDEPAAAPDQQQEAHGGAKQAPRRPLLYARVVADARPAIGEPLFKVLLEVAPGVTAASVSSDVFCFQGTLGRDSSDGSSAGAGQPNAPALPQRPWVRPEAAGAATAAPSVGAGASAASTATAEQFAVSPAEAVTAVRTLLRAAEARQRHQAIQ